MSAGWSATPTSSTAPLLLGATTVLYEGKPVGTPDPGAFWRVASEHGVKALFTAPTAIRAIRRKTRTALHLGKYDLSALKYLFLAGERLDPDTYHWASEKLGIPVVDHWWQTETGWAIAANPMGVEPLPIKPGSPTVPMPGYDVRILHADGSECDAGEEGVDLREAAAAAGHVADAVGRRRPLQSRPTCRAFPGYYLTGDGGYFDEDGYLFVMGRIDDVINVAGHRLSTGSIEAVLAAHPAVAECAVIGVADEIKGQVPRGLVVLKAGASADGLAEELVAAVRDEHRRRGVFQAGRRRSRAAEDPLGQDPAQDDARHRRRPRRAAAVDHRGPGRARRAAADPAELTLRTGRARAAPTRSRGTQKSPVCRNFGTLCVCSRINGRRCSAAA